jgi:fumarate hydratase class II
MEKDVTLREAALALGYVSAEQFDRVVNPAAMVRPAKRFDKGS